jgi:hypothetical protein
LEFGCLVVNGTEWNQMEHKECNGMELLLRCLDISINNRKKSWSHYILPHIGIWRGRKKGIGLSIIK